MKLIKFLFILLTVSFISNSPCHHSHPTHSKSHSLRKHKIHAHQLPLISKDGLPSTPKALTLKNHFGASPNDSPYGPMPTLVRKEVSTRYPDGTLHIENQTEIIHLPEGVISDCEIKSQKHYPLCFNLNTCDLCASNPYCGTLTSSLYYNNY